MAGVLSTRVATTEALVEMAGRDARIVLVCADSLKVIKAEPFQDAYPDRFIDVGIAEQNAVGLAAGLASCGFIPFVVTYAGFITMRACEQVRTFVAYPGLSVKFVGANGGIGGGEREGVTHQFFEDLGILRTFPGMTVVNPCDASQVKEAVKSIAVVDGPAYVRIGSGRDPVIFETPASFNLGKIRLLKEYGHDVALFGCGSLISRVLVAARLLEEAGISSMVVEVHTLKPLDTQGICAVLARAGAAVTVEDHNIIGGLGSAIAEVVAEKELVPLVRVGLRDVFPESGLPDELFDRFGMGIDDIMAAARSAIERKKRRQKGE